MNYPPQYYPYQAQGQGPMAGPGGPPGYPPYVVYGMPGGERPDPGAFAAPPPGYYAAAPPPPHSYYQPPGMGPQWVSHAPPSPPAQESGTGGFFNFGNERFVMGLLVGAAATFLLTNETVQKTAIKSMVRVWLAVQGGFEELKERFRDAEAEIQAEE